jgi:hypothetical protein
MTPVIRFPRGGGGNWLANLIWHMERGDWTHPTVNTVYDGQPKCSLRVEHWVEFKENGSIELTKDSAAVRNIVFSTDRKFNLYLNFCVKQRFAFFNVDQLLLPQQIFDLSNTGKFVFENPLIQQCYCEHIDLNYALLFNNPDAFLHTLYNILQQAQVKFAVNQSYALQSIDNYTKSVLNPADIVDNHESLIWWAWCHAVSLLHDIPVNGMIVQARDVADLAHILEPAASTARDIALANCFTWKK